MTSYLDDVAGSFDPLSPELSEEFWETLAEMRERCPALRSDQYGGFVALTRYEDCTRAAMDWRTYSSASGAGPVPLPNEHFRFLPLEADPPLHKALRAVLNPYFLPGAVAKREPHMRSLTVELLDTFSERGSCEFVSEFAALLPGRVVYEAILGAPREELPQILSWVHTMIHQPDERWVFDEYVSWVKTLVSQRSGDEAGDDVIAGLVHATVDGRPLTDMERAQILSILIVAALDTTENALTNMVFHLATKPDIAADLRRGGPEDIKRSIEEFLRFEAPAPANGRTTTCPVQVDGEQLSAGERVMLYWGAANRDERHFPNPDVLDFARAKNDHLSFGWGPHACIGRHVARLELRVALEEILRRLPDMALAPGAEIVYRVAMSRSPQALPIVFTPTGRVGTVAG